MFIILYICGWSQNQELCIVHSHLCICMGGQVRAPWFSINATQQGQKIGEFKGHGINLVNPLLDTWYH